MSDDKLKVPRNIPTTRISAYECTILPNGQIVKNHLVKNGGWYGPFTEERLQNTIMPKLAEYTKQDYSYPFLVTTHELNKNTEVHINRPSKGKAKASDLSFNRRKRQSLPKCVAVVYSETECKVLPEIVHC
jgi:hypothetical protein